MRLYHVVFTILPILFRFEVFAGNVPIYARRPDDAIAMSTLDAQKIAHPTGTVQTSMTSIQKPSSISTSNNWSPYRRRESPTYGSAYINECNMWGSYCFFGRNFHWPTVIVTDASDTSVLPIVPKITPALGVAGVVLIILGMAYNLIGIKNQWWVLLDPR
jgi:hypothetical protein